MVDLQEDGKKKWVFTKNKLTICYTKMDFDEMGRNGWMNHGFLLILP